MNVITEPVTVVEDGATYTDTRFAGGVTIAADDVRFVRCEFTWIRYTHRRLARS